MKNIQNKIMKRFNPIRQMAQNHATENSHNLPKAKIKWWTVSTYSAMILALCACTNGNELADAYGNFEADETTISSEANGKILAFNLSEGQEIVAGMLVAEVDSTQLVLKKKQLRAAIKAIKAKLPNEAIQLASIDEQLKTLATEKARIERLVAENAAPSKSLDDIKAQIETVKKERTAAANRLTVQRNGMLAEIGPLKVQIEEVNDQIGKCKLRNPLSGTVLNTYVEKSEMTAAGRPIYSIASLNPLILKAYVTENELSTIKIGESYTVRFDQNGGMTDTQGKLIWVSDEAEFTPKMIQTRDERANQVYAIKLEVVNNGSLKIGMPAEVYFNQSKE
ncbi:HlyD family efflux transporter periplasmic adaptor subunit [bacterium]|nr:HlyD family efflux transporter periplasmic adaptor subunit [bacterium]